MTTWGNLCRVCSSPAEYEIFAKIPNYLHSTSNDFINWQKPINVLLEEITGFKLNESDGMPHKICALCISYLKHASTFREQAIKNMLSLKVIHELMCLKKESKKSKSTVAALQSDKDSIQITEQNMEPMIDRKVDPNVLLNNMQAAQQFKVNKELLNAKFNAPITPPSQQYIEEQMRYINLLFDKEINIGINSNANGDGRRRKNNGTNADGDSYPTPDIGETADYESETTSDENQNQQDKESNIFSYREKNFQEDDIMQELHNLNESITVNLPISCKERKCRACFRRFMFEETYKEHMDNCTEYNFLQFTEEIYRLWHIRRSKAVSPHEYIRRTIFSLRKICDWLKEHCTDILVPELIIANGDSAIIINHNDGGRVATTSTNDTTNQNTEFFVNQDTILKRISSSEEDEEHDLDRTLVPNVIGSDTIDSLYTPRPEHSQSSPTTDSILTPITIQNNILYEIERAEHQQKQEEHSKHSCLGEQILNTSATSTSSTLLANNQVRKPIAVHANVANILAPSLIDVTVVTGNNVVAYPSPSTNIGAVQNTPSISVRKDLVTSSPIKPMSTTFDGGNIWPLSAVEEQLHQLASQASPLAIPLASSPKVISARCNPCNMCFEGISQFEIHNAMHHNNIGGQEKEEQSNKNDDAAEAERRRIIAMFEDEDNM